MPPSFPTPDDAEKKDALWHLLGRSPLPPADPWFTVRALARCRYEAAEPEAAGVWLDRLWKWVLGGGLSAALAIFIFLPHLNPSPGPARQEKAQEAFEVMASLDVDSDANSPSLQDSSSL